MRRPAHLAATTTLAVALALLSACSPSGATGGSGSSASPPTVSPSPIPASAPLPLVALRYALIDRFGRPWFCDPDFYPVARTDELDLARQRFDEVRADEPTFLAIVERLALNAGNDFTDEQTLAVYREWKTLNAILLEPIGSDRFSFEFRAVPAEGSAEGTLTSGTIAPGGAIEIKAQAPAGEPPCPICLARGTRIDTPAGPVPVERLRVGDPIWTLDEVGRRVRGTIVEVGATLAPIDHHVVRLVLADGRVLTASPGHPLADGRTLRDIGAGDVVDGALVTRADVFAYAGDRTFDLLASGPTGAYWAGGIPLGSTLLP